MFRKIAASLIMTMTGAVVTAISFAAEYALTPGMTVEYILPQQQAQIFTNYFFWKITASCHITTPDAQDEVLVRMLNKTGSVNGIELHTGDTMSLIIHTDDQLQIIAEPAAQVELTNQGENTIKAICTA